jgi:hypothetical protein
MATADRLAARVGGHRALRAPSPLDVLTTLLALCPNTLPVRRDRGLLALDFAGAFRRSELVALEIATISPTSPRRLPRTDPAGQDRPERGGAEDRHPPERHRIRPVEAVQTWLQADGILDGSAAVRYAPGASTTMLWRSG